MINIKSFLAVFLGAYLGLALPCSYAQKPPGEHFKEIFNQLHLTDDQQKQLDANKQQHRSIMGNLRRRTKSCRDALKDELMKPQLDMARVNQLHGQIKALMSQMEDNRLSSILAVRSILTTDQFTQFVNLMQKHEGEEHEEHKE